MFEINLQAARIVVLRRRYAHTSRHSTFLGKCFWQVNIFEQLVPLLARSVVVITPRRVTAAKALHD